MSEDAKTAITIIAFVGSVFSPHYFRERRRGYARPDSHCAINVVLRSPRANRWAFTEWSKAATAREQNRLQIGKSVVSWCGDELVIELEERGVPIPTPIVGKLRLYPDALFAQEAFSLDHAGRHVWAPVAPAARFELELRTPGPVLVRGRGYHDANVGVEPLEQAFSKWTWCRATSAEGTTVLYDVDRRQGAPLLHSRRYGAHGSSREIEAPEQVRFPSGLFGVERRVRANTAARLVATLTDAPFYVRSRVAVELEGSLQHAVHESLSLDRFESAWVQAMLPFRTRRRR